MTSIFQVFVDKENAGPLGKHPKGKISSTHEQMGKTFQSQSLTTPRKALGDVNRDLQANPNTPASQHKQFLKSKHTDTSNLTFKKPLLQTRGQMLSTKSSNVQDFKLGQAKKHKSSLAEVSQQIPILMPTEDRENMYIYKDSEDNFEDILPKKDRISTYIDKVLNWRPPCLVGRIESDDEDEDERRQRIIQSLDNMPLPVPLLVEIEEQVDLEKDLFDHSVLEEVELPTFDCCSDPCTFDDAAAIGTLHLYSNSS
ncbi:hypothetical protein ScPMuIL_006758 [Solemya velum]